MATKCAINGRQWGAYDGRRHLASTFTARLEAGFPSNASLNHPHRPNPTVRRMQRA